MSIKYNGITFDSEQILCKMLGISDYYSTYNEFRKRNLSIDICLSIIYHELIRSDKVYLREDGVKLRKQYNRIFNYTPFNVFDTGFRCGRGMTRAIVL